MKRRDQTAWRAERPPMTSPRPSPQAAGTPTPPAVSELRSFAVPSPFARHPLVDGRYFYTFPERLLTLVVDQVVPDRFDAQILNMERQLSTLVNDRSVYVGIRREAPIAYGYLEASKPVRFSYDDVKHLNWGKSEQEIEQFLRVVNPRRDALTEPLRGYCGWLMTNKTYVAEHDQLICQHARQVRDHDFPIPILAACGPPMPQSAIDETWVNAFRQFYSRWRLQSLVGPGLPMPLPVLLPSFPLLAQNLAAAEGGTSVFLPDIVPISTRGVIHETLDDAVHGGQQPEHLAEWHRIVRRDNTAKNKIARYARLFGLQHYWRLLFERHPNTVVGNKAHLVDAMAEFFNLSIDSIRKDLTFIGKRLGKGWERRPDPLA
jgi:hypothetical protein